MLRKYLYPIVLFSLILYTVSCISTVKSENPGNSDFVVHETSIKGNNYILFSDSGGLLSLMFNNSRFIFKDSGLEFMYNGFTFTSSDLENIDIDSGHDRISVTGIINEYNIEFKMVLIPVGDTVSIIIHWNSPIPEDFNYCNFAIHLDSFNLRTNEYTADNFSGIYPEEFSEMILEEDINNFVLITSNNSIEVESDTPFKLADARAWEGEDYTLLFDLKDIADSVTIDITLPSTEASEVTVSDLYNLRYSQEGYSCNSEKSVFLEWPKYAERPDDYVQILSSEGNIILEGKFGEEVNKWQFNFAGFDFSSIKEPGDYYIRWAGGDSEMFTVDNTIYDDIWRDALEVYIPWQMCHISVDLSDRSLSHELCHMDDGVRVNSSAKLVDGFYAHDWPDTQFHQGETIKCNTGGWHDAGDYDLNTAAQSLTVHHLALAYEEFLIESDTATLDFHSRQYVADRPDGIPDIIQQVLWGTRWLLSMQQDDGRIYPGIVSPPDLYYRHLTPDKMSDGINDTGDERNVYIDYQSSEHLKGVIALAAASRVLKKKYPDFAAMSLEAAERGFDYYLSNGKTDHIQTSFIFDDLDYAGSVQTEIAAAAELFLTTGKDEYLKIVKNAEQEIDQFQWNYNIPHNTFRMNYIYAATYLARIYDLIDDQRLREVIITYLESCLERKEYLTSFNNWPYTSMINPWYGESHFPVRFVFDTYYISRVIPDKISVQDCQPLFYWLLGMHPLDNNVYITGLNKNEPDYLFSKQAVSLFGDEPFSVAGAVIPGLCSVGEDIYFDDRMYSFECIEPIIDVSATLVFASFALSESVK